MVSIPQRYLFAIKPLKTIQKPTIEQKKTSTLHIQSPSKPGIFQALQKNIRPHPFPPKKSAGSFFTSS